MTSRISAAGTQAIRNLLLLLAGSLAFFIFFSLMDARLAYIPYVFAVTLTLAALIGVAGGLSAIFSNDVVCLAMTPVVARLCLQRGLNPLPFLIGLACAANIGSAATLIGNPQNMLIGSVLRLDFADYARQALVPVLLSLGVLWGWLVCLPSVRREPYAPIERRVQEPPFDAWQTTKGLTVVSVLMVLFLFTDAPHAVLALVGAALLLLSRRLASSDVIGLVDWSLLVLLSCSLRTTELCGL